MRHGGFAILFNNSSSSSSSYTSDEDNNTTKKKQKNRDNIMGIRDVKFWFMEVCCCYALQQMVGRCRSGVKVSCLDC